MDREQLSALRDAINVVLSWPDDVRDQIAAWLSTAKPNGVDHHPPPIAPISRPAKARGKPANARTAENRLLAALQGSPGSSVSKLAAAAGANRSSTAERLRQLAARGMATKDPEGRWLLVTELAGASPDPTSPSPATS
jgi:DNA invertase Pin-like site-specific DNA recombinase